MDTRQSLLRSARCYLVIARWAREHGYPRMFDQMIHGAKRQRKRARAITGTMDLASAAATLETTLRGIFGASAVHVVHQRGIQVTFERETKDAHIKRQLSLPWQDHTEHVSVLIGLIPAGGGKWDLKMMNAKQDAEALKTLGIAFKRQTAPTLERAVDYAVLWFKKNEAVLKAAVGL